MKVIAINGSPRKSCNTDTLLQKVLNGAASQNAETELIHLYDLQYKGCISCFACKRKGDEHGKCAMNDGLTPILEKLKTVDAIVFGSPIYFMNITSQMAAFLERFLFSNSIYSVTIPTVYPHKIPSLFLYTMNATEKRMSELGMKENLMPYQNYIGNTLGIPPKVLYAYNTYQFSDYKKYESSMFSELEKSAYRAAQFPIDCEKAFHMGISLVNERRI